MKYCLKCHNEFNERECPNCKKINKEVNEKNEKKSKSNKTSSTPNSFEGKSKNNSYFPKSEMTTSIIMTVVGLIIVGFIYLLFGKEQIEYPLTIAGVFFTFLIFMIIYNFIITRKSDYLTKSVSGLIILSITIIGVVLMVFGGILFLYEEILIRGL